MEYDRNSAAKLMNQLGSRSIPFLFIADFELDKIVVIPEKYLADYQLSFKIQNFISHNDQSSHTPFPEFCFEPIEFEKYKKGFEIVARNILHGNSYLLNLTFPSPICSDLDLKTVYNCSHAKYKLLWKEEFVVFSPETFVKIKQSRIYSYPMKGTIDAEIPNARQILIDDKKELAEHYTIVDLIRNDLNLVATDVKVDRFRYFDTIVSNHKTLYQTSSEISGQLNDDWHCELGNILFKLLPAGSVSGAPKPKTLEIIKEAELGHRGYYTGVFGFFDGNALDSAVMIRFIENNGKQLQFRSGGGITSKSNCEEEYQELKNKIYVPLV